jgi:hypothetical protein
MIGNVNLDRLPGATLKVMSGSMAFRRVNRISRLVLNSALRLGFFVLCLEYQFIDP